MRRPARSRWKAAMADVGWVGLGLVGMIAGIAFWAAVVLTAVTEPYDPWNERAAAHKD